MIVTEFYRTREDGVVLVRTYSDSGKMIQNAEGAMYSEAIDPEEMGRTYTETDVDVVGEEATEADYVEALRTLGVDVDG